MKRLSIVTVLVLIGALAFASTAFALASGPPTEDAWVDSSTTAQNTTTFILQSSFNTGSGSCDTISWGYMKFNLSNLGNGAGGTIGYADLDMRVTGTTAVGTATTVSLYAVDDDSWTEANVGTIKPALGQLLSSYTVGSTPTPPYAIQFPTSTAWVEFMNAQSAFVPGGADDNVASIGIRISACGTSATVRLGTSENAGNEPQLHLRSPAPPNAVEVSKASAQPVSWPLYAGLGAVAFVVAAGFVLTRRRTA